MHQLFNKDSISISEAGLLFSVSLDTIRRWEKKGLIKSQRTANGTRKFKLSELSILKNKLSGESISSYKILKASNKTDYSVIELFAGCGGLALGLEHSGLNTKLLVEIDGTAVRTLKTNRPDWNIINQDVKQLDYSNLTADIVTGGFPCQAFSYAGKSLGFEDIRGTLFFEYTRAVKAINPKVILAENVRGLERHDEGKTLQTMIKVLSDLGYYVHYKVLKSQYFDVPQKRERLIIIGIRKDCGNQIAFPKDKNYTVSLKDALENVPESTGQKYSEYKKGIMDLVPEGGYWRNLPIELQKTYMGASYFLGGGKTGMARRLSWNEPSLTLTCNPAQKQTERCHPSESRPLTIREYARIQTFPDDWTFAGSISAQYKQIGNAVPVNLGYYLGKCLIATISATIDDTMEFIQSNNCEKVF